MLIRKQIPARSILALILLFPIFYGMAYLDWIPYIDLFRITGMAFGYITLIILVITQKMRWSRVTIFFAAIQLFVCISTIINNADVFHAFYMTIRVLYVALLMQVYQKDFSPLFKVYQFVMTILSLINLIGLFVFPNGLGYESTGDGVWTLDFLGYDNSHIMFFLPCFCMAETSIISSNRKSDKVYIRYCRVSQLIILLNVVVSMSGTTVIAFAVLLIGMLFNRFGFLKHTYMSLLLIPVIGNILIVFSQKQVGLVNFIATSILGKSITYSGRTMLWMKTLNYIVRKPLFGNGMYDVEDMIRMVGGQHPHNLSLYLLFMGGVLLLAVYIVMIVLMCRRLSTHQGENTRFYRWVLLSILLYLIAESQYNFYLFWIFLLIWYAPEMDRNCTRGIRQKIK